MTRPVFKIVLTPETGDTVDPILRLRAALKTLRRAFRLRCISAEEIKTPTSEAMDYTERVSDR